MSGCECHPDQFPFACQRHQCHKTAHWHTLCQTRADYFRLWEEGRGPGQYRPSEPGLLQKGINLAGAVVRHVANGGRLVSDEVYGSRLATCRACASLDVERMVCREPSCGCYVEKKARWASEECPRQRWLCAEAGSAHPESEHTTEPQLNSEATEDPLIS